MGGQFDLGVGFALILSAFCTPHRIPTAARSSEAAERQIINQKKIHLRSQQKPIKSAPACILSGLHKAGERGGGAAVSVNDVLPSFTACLRQKEKQEGRMEGGVNKKKSLQCESTCVTKENDNDGDARDDGNHANTNAFEGKWSAGGSLIGRKAKTFQMFDRTSECPNEGLRVWMRGSDGHPEGPPVRLGITLISGAVNSRPDTCSAVKWPFCQKGSVFGYFVVMCVCVCVCA